MLNRYIIITAVITSLLAFLGGCSERKEISTDDIETGSKALPLEQGFEVAEYSSAAVEISISRDGLRNGFIDSNNDRVPDGVKWGEDEIKGDVILADARGFAYGNARYVVFYPAKVTALPAPGQTSLLGFLHYFDTDFLDCTFAVLVKQMADDPARTGARVIFIGPDGQRTGNPAYAFYNKSEIEALPSYTRWSTSGLDYALTADPKVDAFIAILKDFGFADQVMIIAFKWFNPPM